MPKSQILFYYTEDSSDAQSAAVLPSQHNQAKIYFSEQYDCLVIDISHVDLFNSTIELIGNPTNY